MINSRKRIVVALSSLALLFIMILGISYAYYAAEVKGNTSSDPSLKLTSGYLSIVYEGGSSEITGGSTSGTTSDLIYTKNFSVTNDGVADSYFGVWIKDYQVLDSSGTETTLARPEDWTYVLKSGNTIIKTGTFPTEGEAIITAYPLAINETKNLTLTVTYNYITEAEGGTDQSADMGKVLSFDVAVTQAIDSLNDANENTLLNAINTAYQASIVRNETDLITIPGRAISNADEAIILTTEDDYGTSYVYRGNVTNNYVNYSGMCWRIVRVQGDGTIKLVLADEKGECNASTYSIDNTTTAFINDAATTKYNTNDETVNYSTGLIPDLLSTWISEKSFDTSKLENNKWCNDTSISSISTYYYYGPRSRLYDITSASPDLKCNQTGLNNSTATIVESNIALLTADEAAFAGMTQQGDNASVNANCYLRVNASEPNVYFTMSPAFDNEGDSGRVYTITKNGELSTAGIVYMVNGAIRPAIVLKKDVTATTNSDTTTYGEPGTQQNPYEIN